MGSYCYPRLERVQEANRVGGLFPSRQVRRLHASSPQWYPSTDPMSGGEETRSAGWEVLYGPHATPPPDLRSHTWGVGHEQRLLKRSMPSLPCWLVTGPAIRFRGRGQLRREYLDKAIETPGITDPREEAEHGMKSQGASTYARSCWTLPRTGGHRLAGARHTSTANHGELRVGLPGLR